MLRAAASGVRSLPSELVTGTTYSVSANAQRRPLLRWIAACWIGYLSLSSCGPAPDDPDTSTTGSNASALDSPQTTQNRESPTGARLVDQSRISEKDLIAAILKECHTKLEKRMQQIKVLVTIPSGRQLLVQADLPNRFRVQEGLRAYLINGPEVQRLDDGAVNEPVTESEAHRAMMRPLSRIVDAVAFGPLYRATSCRRDGADFILTDATGTTTKLQLYKNTLLPSAIIYSSSQDAQAQASVYLDGYLRTKTTWIVNKATINPLGTCSTSFEDGGVVFANDFFKAKIKYLKADPGKTTRMSAPGVVRESESATPIQVVGKAMSWVMQSSGSSWSQQHKLYKPVIAELETQNQRISGFPMIWQEDGQQFLGAPFARRKAGKPLIPPEGWQIKTSPETSQLVVYPAKGSVEDRIRIGTTQLQRHVANRKLKMIGPIIAQPFLHLHEAVPSPSKLADCKVRMSVRIQ